MKWWLLTILKSFLPDNCIIHETENKYIIVIINYGEEPFIDDNSIEIKMKMIMNTIKKKLDIPLSLAISKPFSNPNKLANCFNHAKNMLEIPNLENSIIFIDDEPIYEPNLETIPIILNQIYELLLSGEEDHITAKLVDIFPSNKLTQSSFKQNFYSVRGVIVNVIYKLSLSDTIVVPDFNNKKTHAELFNEMLNCCQVICHKIDSNKHSHNDELRENVLKYITKNYNNPQLCVTAIAEEFYISNKYVSQFIKEQTGKTYTEYLESIRLDHSVILFKNSKLTINQIATEVGFTSQNTFYKAFKRIYHISPSTWRDTMS